MYCFIILLVVNFFCIQNFCMQQLPLLGQAVNSSLNVTQQLIRSIESELQKSYINPLISQANLTASLNLLHPDYKQYLLEHYQRKFETNIIDFPGHSPIHAENTINEEGQQVVTSALTPSDGNISISYDGQLVVAKTTDPRMMTFYFLNQRTVYYRFSKPIKALVFANTSYLLIIVLEDEVIFWRIEESKTYSYKLHQPTMAIFSPNDSQVAIIYEDSKIYFIEESNDPKCFVTRSEDPILAIAYRSETMLAFLKPNGHLSIIDTGNNRLAFQTQLDIDKVSVSANNVYANTQRDLFLRDIVGSCYKGKIEDLRVILERLLLPQEVSSLFLNATPSRLLIGLSNNVLRVMQHSPQGLVSDINITGPLCNAKISHDGKVIACVSTAGVIEIISFEY